MQPISQCSTVGMRNIRAVLFDIDETLTWHGGLPAAAFVGDSFNDEPTFGFFPHSAGVTNFKEPAGK